MNWKLAFALTIGSLSLLCASARPSFADAPKCEPDKLATKYPGLVGKTIKIGTDGETPPYAMRDPEDFNRCCHANDSAHPFGG